MTIASCPKCDDQVRLPASASSKAKVSCPLCQAEFVLSDILDDMPPLLIVIDDPEAASAAVSADDLGLGRAEELSLAPPEEVTTGPSLGIQSSVAPASTTTAAPRKRRAAPRQKRKKSPAMEIVKVVLGGIAGLTIAQLILWWMPWDEYRRDPFKLGPKISGYAPWAVPEKFHGKKASSEKDAGDVLPESKPFVASSESPELSESGLPVLDFGDPSKPEQPSRPKTTRQSRPKSKPASDRAKKPADDVDDRDSSVGDFEPAPPKDTIDPPSLVEPDSEMTDAADNVAGGLTIDLDTSVDLNPAMLDPITDAKPKTVEPEPTDPPEMDESPVVRLPNATKVTAEDLDSALLATEPAIQAWTEAPDLPSYRAFAKLGEAVALVEEARPKSEEAVHSLLELLGSESAKMEILAKAGTRLLEDPDQREGSGVLLVGVVKGVERKGDLYETQLEVTSGEDPVLVYDDADPGEVYKADSKILVLGAIIEDPAANLTGYDGSGKSVVWSGAALAVADE